MKMNSILAVYKENHPVQNAQIANDEEIYAVKPFIPCDFLEKGESKFTIYYAQNVEHAAKYPENLIFVTAPDEVLTEQVYNWIQISKNEFSTLADDLSQILADQFQLQDLQLDAIASLNDRTGLTASFSKAAMLLDTSVVAMDLSGRIISSSRPFKLKDPLWQESVAKGYCPPFFVEHINNVREKSLSEGISENSPAPAVHICPREKLHYMSCRLYSGRLLYGYLFFIQESENFHHLSSQVMDILEDALLQSIRSDDYSPVTDNLVYDKLFTDIFDGISPEQIRSRLESGKICLPNRMLLVCIKPRYYKTKEYFPRRLLPELNILLPDSRLVIYHKYIVAITSLQPSEYMIPQTVFASLMSFCMQEQLICGISNPFSDPQMMKVFFDQASRTAELANIIKNSEGIFYYKDYAIYDVISYALEEKKKVEYCTHPALEILQNYDSVHDGSLYATLKALAANDFNSAATAKALFIHRNSLGYRKLKIAELTGLDLDDMKTRYQLCFSFFIIDLINASGGSPAT